MSTHRQIFYHVVFGTKNREKTITPEHDAELYRYISGIIKNKNSKLYQINGVEDHIHMLLDLHPSICLSDLIKDIKVASSIWMKATGKFKVFVGWQEGYGAFTSSNREKSAIASYIENQKEHHRTINFYDEYKALLVDQKVAFDERYLL